VTDIKWIKLSVNMFDDEKIKLIRTMPEGDKIIVIWVQLLCLAGKTNDNGSIYMGQNIYYTDEMMAAICEQPVNTMRLALHTLEQFGMVEKTENGLIDIVNWEKHQNIEGMERIRIRNAERQQLHYYRKKIKNFDESIDTDKLSNDADELKTYYENLTLGLTLPHGTDKEKEKDKNINTLSVEPDDVPYKDVIDYLNEKAGKNYKHATESTRRMIKARHNEGFTIGDFKKVIDTKCADWLNNSEMSKYLRPQTLFGTKFESYLNERKEKGLSKEQQEEVFSYDSFFDGV